MNPIIKHLPLLEKIFLTAFVAGVLLRLMQINSAMLNFALIGLAMIFLLYAFRPAGLLSEVPSGEDNVSGENEKVGFLGLLATVIVPKILWISSALSAIGIALYLINLGNKGYQTALMDGIVAIAISLLVLVVAAVQGIKKLRINGPPLLRALPLLVADLWILFY